MSARNVPPTLAAELEKLSPWQERLFWAVVEHPGPIVVQRGRRNGVTTVKLLIRDWAATMREPAASAVLSFAEIDELMGEDPDDRTIREAHGFGYDDDFMDRSLLCRNGCGSTYYDVAIGKIRECPRQRYAGWAEMPGPGNPGRAFATEGETDR